MFMSKINQSFEFLKCLSKELNISQDELMNAIVRTQKKLHIRF